jgi:hypothetical protein
MSDDEVICERCQKNLSECECLSDETSFDGEEISGDEDGETDEETS